MINGLDIYYSKKIGQGLKPISNNNKQSTKSKWIKTYFIKERDVKKYMAKD